ncbi:MAG: gamma-glutamyl-gamma-aminobutyrate hydrolase family protein [Candidatus Omnitrophica bacterium]|nr:gamma-glutamyl-gamma-aminobutyrate hydrolase family protein [Candidatus Omnitrophota bacterium]
MKPKPVKKTYITMGVELESYSIFVPENRICRELHFPRRSIVEKGERFTRDWSIGTEYNSKVFTTIREAFFLLKTGLRKYAKFRQNGNSSHQYVIFPVGGWIDRFAGSHVHLSLSKKGIDYAQARDQAIRFGTNARLVWSNHWITVPQYIDLFFRKYEEELNQMDIPEEVINIFKYLKKGRNQADVIREASKKYQRKHAPTWQRQFARRYAVAICYGMQLLNVIYGGSLFQDIRSNIKKARNHCSRRRPMHTVRVQPGSLCYRIFKRNSFLVHSDHHGR